MSTVKNWEAQAKTNSILASALKTLEQRVDDLTTLLEWCDDVDSQRIAAYQTIIVPRTTQTISVDAENDCSFSCRARPVSQAALYQNR